MEKVPVSASETTGLTGGYFAGYRGTLGNIPDQSYLNLIRERYSARLLVHAEFANPPLPVSLSSSSDYHVSVTVALNLTLCDTLQHIQNSISRSAMIWRTAKDGELLALCKQWTKFRPETDFQLGISSLLIVASNRLSGQFECRLEEEIEIEKAGAEVVLRLAAHITCGLGVGDFGWASQTLVPVLVRFRGKSFLSLVPVSVLRHKDRHKFTLVEQSSVRRNHHRSLATRHRCYQRRPGRNAIETLYR